MEIVGGLNLPSKRGGRVNATWPLSRLALDDHGLRISGRGPLHLLVRDRQARYADIESAQAVQGSLGTRGVRFRVRNLGTWYFWTTDRDRVLDFVGDAGVQILEGCPRLPLLYSEEWQ